MKQYDPLFGIESELVINLDDPTQCGIKYSGDCQELLDANAAMRNAEAGLYNKHINNHETALGYKVASFDANAIMYFKVVHNLNFFNPQDREIMIKMIDTDPDYRGFKTTNDRIT